jgi:hypothetical protein
MSITPTTPNITPIVTQLHPISTYLKAHEHLLIVLVLVVLSWFALGKVQSVLAAHDNANLAQAKVTAAVQQEKNDALAKQIAQDKADYTALSTQVQARDAQLVQLQATLVTALARQQKVDATLPPTELVARWNKLVPQAGATVTNGQVTLSDSGAVATVVALERAPELDKQLAASNEELINAKKLVAAEGTQITDLTTSVAGLRVQITDNQAVCQAQIAVVKAEARRSKRRWFYAGVVVGFIGRQLIKSETGF